MAYRYSLLERELKRMYRMVSPVPRSPWTAGEVANICAVNLVPPETLIEFFSGCINKLRELKGDAIGDYLDFGVFNGNSIGSMYLASQRQKQPMRLLGFDAYEGLPPGSEDIDDGVWKKGFYSCSFEQMQACLKERGINPEEITWVNGWYDQTLTSETAEKYEIKDLGIVFIDCDTYSSSKTVLDFLAPRIKSLVIICLDDWKLNDLDIKGMGEYKSFNEFLEANPHLRATPMKSYNRKSRTFLVQPTHA